MLRSPPGGRTTFESGPDQLLNRRAVFRLHHSRQSSEELLPSIALLPAARLYGTEAVFELVLPAELHELLESLASGLQPVFLLVHATERRELVNPFPAEAARGRARRIDQMRCVFWSRFGTGGFRLCGVVGG
ncbi:unnamed protein product [Gemmata massiliana]|uniref:Uncharacterized protein n=1 Tax=Gemmata massiliana TaxID=1210884 RepID=A0A6P2D1C8_9BACT|nr:unnamed protein product [Gemmata massiliana]